MKRFVVWLSIVGALCSAIMVVSLKWDDLYALVYPESRFWGKWEGEYQVVDMDPGEKFLQGVLYDFFTRMRDQGQIGSSVSTLPVWATFERSGLFELEVPISRIWAIEIQGRYRLDKGMLRLSESVSRPSSENFLGSGKEELLFNGTYPIAFGSGYKEILLSSVGDSLYLQRSTGDEFEDPERWLEMNRAACAYDERLLESTR